MGKRADREAKLLAAAMAAVLLVAEEGEAVIAPAILVGRRVDADRERDHPGEDDGGDGDQHGEPDLVPDHFGHRQVELEGIAKIALQHAENP